METGTGQLNKDSGNTFGWVSLLCLVFVLAVFTSSAQTQQGYVKTRGRLVNGSVVAGQRLSGVTVQVKGSNAVVSKANGTFSFPVPANRFVVQSVKKQGYVLVDPEVTARQYSYSSNPLILVMETPKKLNEDKLAVERNLYKNLEDEYKSKNVELKSLLDQNKIAIEEYRAVLSKLQDEFTSKQSEIDYMAYYFSRIDYDQLDEFNQIFSDFILNGRLSEAYDLWCSRDGFHDDMYNVGQPLVDHDSITVVVAASNEATTKNRPTSSWWLQNASKQGSSRKRSSNECLVTFNWNVEDVPVFISIDDEAAAEIENEYTLITGNHKVLITADGYEPLNSSIEVDGEDDYFYFELKKTREKVESKEQNNEVID